MNEPISLVVEIIKCTALYDRGKYSTEHVIDALMMHRVGAFLSMADFAFWTCLW